VIALWMGIGSVFITGRTAAASQSVLDQMTRPPRAYDAQAPATVAPKPGKTPIALVSVPEKQNSLERLGTR
jgi:hypothetical protein